MSVYLSDGTASGRLDVWLGNGDCTFQSPTNVPSTLPLAVAEGDFNNDGNSDLLVGADAGDFSTGEVQVKLGDGRGGFGPAGSVLGGLHGALAVGDLNGDGNLDAVALAEGGSYGAAFLGNGAGGLFGGSDFYSTIH